MANQRNFIVAVRIRPPSNTERINRCHRKNVVPVDKTMLVYDPPHHVDEWNLKGFVPSGVNKNTNLLYGHSRPKNLKYAFDHVFDEYASQEEVYRNTSQKVINQVLDGYNATVFAYGATGSGTTHNLHYIYISFS
jgi:kinesin family protein 18/19